MTVAELLLANSSVASGIGTVLDNLLNIEIIREVYYGVNVDVIDNTNISVDYDIISVNISDPILMVDTTLIGVDI